MPEESTRAEMSDLLQGALAQAEALQARIESGEEIEEKELTALARMLATQMEEVRGKLESAFGPIDPDVLRARMKIDLSPEEFEEWEAGEQERVHFRNEFAKEQPIRSQLGDLN
jgi:multidrug efflux pump subunit AcrA (membrane-fusion protein)